MIYSLGFNVQKHSSCTIVLIAGLVGVFNMMRGFIRMSDSVCFCCCVLHMELASNKTTAAHITSKTLKSNSE